jgi:hypothetical protein
MSVKDITGSRTTQIYKELAELKSDIEQHTRGLVGYQKVYYERLLNILSMIVRDVYG